MVVPIILAVMVLVVVVHGFLLRGRNTRVDDHGFYFDLSGSHTHTFVNSMQDFAPTPRGRGFDTKHWTSVYWG